ncbi:DUF6791 domain-containing protein [Rhizobium beringeri]
MFQELVSHNKDIEQLLLKGYAIALDSGHLVIRDIPYLDEKGALCWGAIVCKLTSADSKRFIMEDHQIYFAGSHPHGLDGQPIPNLGGDSTPFRSKALMSLFSGRCLTSRRGLC